MSFRNFRKLRVSECTNSVNWGMSLSLQNPYIYLVLIFEACATFIGQLSVLCLIALFGAATTAMVSIHSSIVSYSLISFYFCKDDPLHDDFYRSWLLSMQIDAFVT